MVARRPSGLCKQRASTSSRCDFLCSRPGRYRTNSTLANRSCLYCYLQTFFSEVSPQEKIDALRRACEGHVKLTKECSKGLGQDRCDVSYTPATFSSLRRFSAPDISMHFIVSFAVNSRRVRMRASTRWVRQRFQSYSVTAAGRPSARQFSLRQTAVTLRCACSDSVQSLQMGTV
jgi:hypothetical protein